VGATAQRVVFRDYGTTELRTSLVRCALNGTARAARAARAWRVRVYRVRLLA